MPLRFSIVVPTHKRPEALARCLAALGSIDYPREAFEVIVVRDGEEAGVEELEKLEGGGRVTWLTQPPAGPAAARNLGASRAALEYLAFTDDDCRPRPGWLRSLAARLAAAPGAVVGGKTRNGLPSNPFSTASQAVVAQLTRLSIEARAPFFASSNLAMARGTFERLDGFDASFRFAAGEDRDLCDRCLAHGVELVHAPEAVVDHFHELSLGSFLRQHFRYGRAACLFRRAKSARTGKSGPGPPRWYAELVRGAVQETDEPTRARLSLVAASQVAAGLGYFAERFRSRPRSTTSEGCSQCAEGEVPRGAEAAVDEKH